MTNHPLTRRQILKGGGLAIGGVALGGLTLTQTACPGKSVLLFTSTLRASLTEIKPLLPKLASQIAEAITATETFESAYRAGKFADAVATFKNLAPTINEILANADIGNPDIKRYVALIGVGLATIGSLLESQSGEPKVAAAISASADVTAKETVRRAAASLDSIVAAVRP